MVTASPAAGFQVSVAGAASVLHVLSLVLPRTDSVWVRAGHEGGTSITTDVTAWVAPRSTVRVDGQVPSLLSQ
jgi:hypothetical protein